VKEGFSHKQDRKIMLSLPKKKNKKTKIIINYLINHVTKDPQSMMDLGCFGKWGWSLVTTQDKINSNYGKQFNS